MQGMKEFHARVGELIMLCQCIERDVKIIYAGMMEGEFYSNFRLVERQSLGQVLVLLTELDYSDHRPYFSEEDYKLLDNVRFIRNHWAHQAYAEFVYKSGDAQEKAFRKEQTRLEKELEKLKGLQRQTEKIRFDVLERYRRL